MSQEAEVPAEDLVSKYKRLLTLARSSLEANQTSIAAKDKYITQLQKALSDEKTQKMSKRGSILGKEEETLVPRNLLRRIDVDDTIWVLIEYDGAEDTWISFGSSEELSDFVQRIPGVPLVIPQKCYSAAESARIESESTKRVDRVVEEFRRFKVRTEIARKSKDAESKQVLQRNSMSVHNASMTPSSPYPSSSYSTYSSPDAVSNGSGESNAMSELLRIKAQLSDQEAKWRKAYETVVRENELLRTRGGEALLAAQWRERYEACLREKDALSDKLRNGNTGPADRHGDTDTTPTRARPNGDLSHSTTSFTPGGEKTIEEAYTELSEEYKDFRLRVRAAEEKRQSGKEKNNINNKNGSNMHDASSSSSNFGDYDNSNSSGGLEINSDIYSSAGGGGGGLRGMGLGESKIQYVRHMVFQYLTCKDSIVKPHIESALVALFRFNELERLAIDEQRKADTEDTITSITNYLGLFSA